MKEPKPNLTSKTIDKTQDLPSPIYPSSNISPVTDNGEIEPVLIKRENTIS